MNGFCVENATVTALRMEMKIPQKLNTGETGHLVWGFCALTLQG